MSPTPQATPATRTPGKRFVLDPQKLRALAHPDQLQAELFRRGCRVVSDRYYRGGREPKLSTLMEILEIVGRTDLVEEIHHLLLREIPRDRRWR